ncbi:MAG: flagellar motor switch phosphatase FliY [Clostridium sp.]|nr:flagellar motor switch phosphatase FliY [Clostridium sp.]MCM1547138.1 flagellar motor switch phosphatase FliY [Ruminococcus sp.]
MSVTLDAMKTDALSEVYNVAFGSGATAVSGMIDSTVSIINPAVTVCKASEVVSTKLGQLVDNYLFDDGKDNVYVKFKYTKGVSGPSALVLNSNDMQMIVCKLMGMPMEIDEGFEFDEMRLSAVTEVMNQMISASVTTMSQMLNTPVEISSPETSVSSDENTLYETLEIDNSADVCAVAFDFKVDDAIDSKFAVLLPVKLANQIASVLMGMDPDDESDDPISSETISTVKRDAIGEIQNIMMGSAATALSNFMSAKVWITTPVVDIIEAGKYDFAQLDPSICVKIDYVMGIHGASFLVLKQSDVQLMVNQLMGLPMEVTDDFEFNELNISAVCEIMNQMMGASATTLSEIIKTPTDISTPQAIVVKTVEDILEMNNINSDDEVCAISFDLTIDNVINSQFVTMLSLELANEMADKMLESYSSELDDYTEEPGGGVQEAAPEPPKPEPKPKPAPKPAAPKPAAPKPKPQPQSRVTNKSPVQPLSMEEFDDSDEAVDGRSFLTEKQYNNLQSLLDVPMEVSVRIGSTTRSIDEVGNFTRGTVIELDTLANEPVDIMVNGNLIARGDVVVVDDNFAVRVTEIVKSR